VLDFPVFECDQVPVRFTKYLKIVLYDTIYVGNIIRPGLLEYWLKALVANWAGQPSGQLNCMLA